MTNEAILKQAIAKAVENGMVFDALKEDDFQEGFWGWLADNNYWEVIFSHSFAKAFWGEDKIYCVKQCEQYDWDNSEDKTSHIHEGFKWHIQQLVLEEEPLK